MVRSLLPVAVLVMCAAGARAEGAAVRGPWLLDVTSDAVTVVWETPTATTGIVRWGAGSGAGALDHEAESASATHHEVRVTGLAALVPPGGELVYSVEIAGSDAQGAATQEVRAGAFNTVPPAGAPFSFIVYGDNRSAPEQHAAVVASMLVEAIPVHFALTTGDLVQNGLSEPQWDEFFVAEQPFLARTPLFVAIGNHEVLSGDWSVTQRLFGAEGFRRVVYGDAELIILNVEVDTLYTLDELAGAQEAWLRDVLATPLARHRLVFIHQGMYSSKPGRDGNFWLRQWLDAFADAGIDAVFSGHDHYAERGFARNGIPYFVHGGGGAPLYETLGPRLVPDHTIAFGETALGYAVVQVDGAVVEITLRGLEGEVLTYFAWGARPAAGDGVTDAPDLPGAAAGACTVAADCGAPPEFACAFGAYQCVEASCRWACGDATSLTFCSDDAACRGSFASGCAGAPVCDVSLAVGVCTCVVAPQCAVDADCAGRPPPVAGCVGAWSCDVDVCEFTPDSVCARVAPPEAIVVAPTPSAAPAAPAPSCAALGLDGAAPLALALVAGARRRRRLSVPHEGW